MQKEIDLEVVEDNTYRRKRPLYASVACWRRVESCNTSADRASALLCSLASCPYSKLKHRVTPKADIFQGSKRLTRALIFSYRYSSSNNENFAPSLHENRDLINKRNTKRIASLTNLQGNIFSPVLRFNHIITSAGARK